MINKVVQEWTKDIIRLERRTLAQAVGYILFLRRRKWFEPKKILLVRPYGVGDYMMTTPAIRAIRTRFPKSRITLAVSRQVTAEIAAYSKLVDGVRMFDSFSPDDVACYDLGVSFFACSDKGIQLLRSLKVPLLVGYLPDHRLRCNWNGYVGINRERENHLENNLLISDAINAPRHGEEVEFGPIDCKRLTIPFPHGWEKGSHLVGINAGLKDPFRKWQKENYMTLIRLISDAFADASFVLVGSSEDRTLNDEIIRMVGTNRLVNLAGMTDWRQLVCIFRTLDVFITSDSGPMHIAFSQGTETIVIFGPTDPKNFFLSPNNKHILFVDGGCNPCYFGTSKALCKIGAQICVPMNRIRPEDVFQKVRDILEKNKINI